MLLLLIIRRLSQVLDESFNTGLKNVFMVSESNTNRRHFKISNTHDQIHYNNNTSKLGGIFKRVVYQMGPDVGSNTFVFESI